MMILPENPEAHGVGFKNNITANCRKTTGDFIECFQENAYSMKDIFLNDDVNAIPFYTNTPFRGLAYTMENGLPMSPRNKSFGIPLNRNLSYLIPLMDSQFHLMTENSDLVPRTFIKILPNSGFISVNLKVCRIPNTDICIFYDRVR